MPPTPPTLRHWPQAEALADARQHPRYVRTMFEIIAPRYDDFTDTFSFGMDRHWKADLLRHWRRLLPPGPVADLACGTGDLAGRLAASEPQRRIVGVDLAPRMVALARQRFAGRPGDLHFRTGDLTAPPFATASLAGISVGYGLRNTADWRQALAAVAGLLQPGGALAVLDFFRPAWRPWRACYLGYLRGMGLLFGHRWHGDGEVYGYIARSIERFTSLGDFLATAAQYGLRLRWRRSVFGGGLARLVLTRQPG